VISSILKRKIRNLPDFPGVYTFLDSTYKVIYVGKAISIKKRVSSYFFVKNLGIKTNIMVAKIADINFIKVFSEFEALLLEVELIKKYNPLFNIQAKDDKSPLYIKITKDPAPLVVTTRKEIPSRGIFTKGPFPSSFKTREVLRIIRRIFPYCHHKNPKKPCLYVHLGLCPYPYQSSESKRNYFTSMKKIKQLLSGKSSLLLRNLTSEMHKFSSYQKYEDAQVIKKQIENIQTILKKYHSPSEFLQTPSLVDDLSLSKLIDLKKALNLKKVPKRIECFDISNISGKNAAGSMVVFINGQVAKNEYRRFKIKSTNTPNDYEMLREVLIRRFNNDWPKPDLIIIDGGKGQVNAAKMVIDKLSINTTIISLAKKLEEIYTVDASGPISLGRLSPARQLVQFVRDEAHRFAISYHRHLRSKSFFN